MKQINEETKIYKGREGWQGETITKDKSGQKWEITTMKRYSGKLVSSAMKIASCSSDGMFRTTIITGMCNPNNSKKLIETKCRVTEKIVREQHAKAVLLFDEQDDTTAPDTNALPVVRVGLKFFTEMQCVKHHKVIYDIKEDYYYYIDIENKTKSFENLYHIKPYSEKFGIGTYYDDKKPEYMDKDEIANLLIDVNAKEKAQAEAQEKAQAERSRKIKEGMQKLHVPSDAVSVIVAQLKEDRSDPMTDYWGHTTTKTVYLAWSTSKRDNFNEMRKAAAKYEPTKFLSDKNPDYENREKYAGGGGYYLGADRHDGWEIRRGYINLHDPQSKDKFAVAIAEGRFFCNDEPQNTIIKPIKSEGIQVLEYSEKACAVFGDTAPFAELLGLNGLGCKFNRFLTHPKTGEKQAGWIFSKKKLNEVTTALNQAQK